VVFQPRYGKLGPLHAEPLSAPAEARPFPVRVSARAALAEAWEIFYRNPVLAAGSTVVLIATSAVMGAAVHLLDLFPHTTDDQSTVSLLGTDFDRTVVQVAIALVAGALFAWPMLLGLAACAVDSARNGEPRPDRLFLGFRHYLRSVAWGLAAGLLSLPGGVLILALVAVGFGGATVLRRFRTALEQARDGRLGHLRFELVMARAFLVASGALAIILVGLIPRLNVLVTGSFLWLAAFAVAARQRGVIDGLDTAWASYWRRFWPLLSVYLLALLVGLAGWCFFGFGIFITMPVAGLLLAVGYRDALASLDAEASASAR